MNFDGDGYAILTEEESILFDVIIAARTSEVYLWGEHNEKWGLEEWKRMFRKRSEKISAIDMTNPHWDIELRKRLLQNAALSIALMKLLDDKKITFAGVHPDGVPSNLSEYERK